MAPKHIYTLSELKQTTTLMSALAGRAALPGFYSMHVDNCCPCQLEVYALLSCSSSKQRPA